MTSLPLLNSAFNLVSSAYNHTKETHPCLSGVCNVAETVAAVAVGSVVGGAQPILNQLEPQSKQGGWGDPPCTEGSRWQGSFRGLSGDIHLLQHTVHVNYSTESSPVPSCSINPLSWMDVILLAEVVWPPVCGFFESGETPRLSFTALSYQHPIW